LIYLPDADTVNYLLKRISPTVGRFRQAIRARSEFVLSPVVHYEVTRYLRLKGAARLLRNYSELVAHWRLSDLLNEDWELAAELWAERHRAGRPIADSDLLVAVTARKAGAILVTNNTRHFESLGVTLENWAD
jgi:tRNA(fMet)-specific endonuclease VapC